MKRNKTSKNFGRVVTFSLVAIVIFFLLSLTGPMSDTKAVSLAETYCSQGLYCSGYHYNKGDNTCEAVFRNKHTNEITKTITVSCSAAEKLYEEYGIDHE